jgi:F-type H+-transporting ATPase subunit epsilon
MFTLTLVTPERKLLAGQEIEEVFVPAYLGEINVLPGHAPLMTILSTGVLRYRAKGEADIHYVAISSGYCQVNPQGVKVLAETAERPEDIDVERAQNSLARAQERLRAADIGVDLLEKFQNKAARAHVRKEVAGRATGNGFGNGSDNGLGEH